MLQALLRLPCRLLGAVRNALRDLRELAAPASLPDPPDMWEQAQAQRRRRTLREHTTVWRAAFSAYRESFKVSFPSAEKDERQQDERSPEGEETESELKSDMGTRSHFTCLLSVSDDCIASTARAGAEAVRPMLQQLYATRAAAYRDGVREFVLGYREAFREAVSAEDTQKSRSRTRE